MKKIQHFSCYLLGLLVLSSCSNACKFGPDFYETAYIHDNGSGRFEIVVDLKKTAKFIKLARYLNSETPQIVQKAVHTVFRRTAKKLRSVPGITTIATAHDAELLRFKLSFAFGSIQALNRAMQKIYAHVDQQPLAYFTMDRQALVRVGTRSMARLIANYQAYDDLFMASFDLETFFKDTTYQLVYHFDREAQGAPHKLARLTEDHKTVIFKQHVFNTQEKSLSLDHKVVFKTPISARKKRL